MAQICSVLNCDNPRFGHGLCNKHYLRQRNNGNPLVVQRSDRGDKARAWQGEDISYTTAHHRVIAIHGSASLWPCAAQCGRQAAHWAYCHDSKNELVQTSGIRIGVPYSADPYDYVPLCQSDHLAFDRKVALK
jgi:hypothetical protein